MSEDRCANCAMALDAERSTCPYCRPRARFGSLAADEDGGGRGIEAGIARLMTEALLAKDEAAELLMLDR